MAQRLLGQAIVMKVAIRNGRRANRPMWALLGLGALWIGCGHDSSSDFANERGAGANSGFPTATGGSSAIGVGSGGGPAIMEPPPLPPEKEKESSFKLPVLSGRWVWAANPLSDKVSVVDTRTLGVRVSTAGFGPTYLAALRAEGNVESAAIVLNAKSRDASVMRLIGDGIDVKTVPTHAGANSWAVSHDGDWAIAWSDANAITSPDPADSFQDITVIDAAGDAPKAYRLSVGYRPSRIFFDAGGTHAFVVSESSLSVIELSHEGPSVSRDITLGASREKATDVAVVPDGNYAVFRVEGSPRVSIVALASGERSDVALSGPVTDLDLVADGTSAIAVVRGRPLTSAGTGGASSTGGAANTGLGGIAKDVLPAMNGGAAGESVGGAGGTTTGLGGGIGGEAAGNGEVDAGAGGVAGASQGTPPASGYGPSEVAVLTLPSATGATASVANVFVSELVGSVAVSNDGAEAVLYTTATDLDRVNVLATDPRSESFLLPRSVYVHAPVDAVFIAPDHSHALVTLRAASGSTGVGFGMVPLIDALPAQVRATGAPITGAAFAPAPTSSAILTSATGLTAYLVRMPELRVDAVPLLNLPLAAGVVPDEGVGYVVQNHPDGQLSLIDLDSAELRTLTGFELSGGIRNGN